MKNNICVHSILPSEKYNSEATIKKLELIFRCGNILSKKLTSTAYNSSTYYGLNGIDYISLCDISKIPRRNVDSSAFYNGAYRSFTSKSLGLIFNKEDIDVIDTMYVDPLFILSLDINAKLRLTHGPRRYSTMYDEVQVKDNISLELLKGILLPIDHLLKSDMGKYTITRELEKIESLLNIYGYDIPIYDLSLDEALNKDRADLTLVKKRIK